MKDLYQRLRVPARLNDEAVLHRAITATSQRDRRTALEATQVLLVADRKRVYDRTHAVLEQIGQVRANLGLLRAPNWLAAHCSDFDTTPLSTPPNAPQPTSAPPKAPSPTGEPSLVAGVLLVTGIVTVLFVLFVIGEGRSGNRTNPTTPPSRSRTEQQSPSTSSSLAPTPPLADRRLRLRTLLVDRYTRAGRPPTTLEDDVAIEANVTAILEGRSDPLPQTGVIARTFERTLGEAPLEVKTQPGNNYFVKVVRWGSNETVLTAFVRGGEPFEVNLPLGSYELRYACGQKWFGPIIDFGEGASYSKCDDRFDFTMIRDGYRGYTVELILQRNGNLKTKSIPEDAF